MNADTMRELVRWARAVLAQRNDKQRKRALERTVEEYARETEEQIRRILVQLEESDGRPFVMETSTWTSATFDFVRHNLDVTTPAYLRFN